MRISDPLPDIKQNVKTKMAGFRRLSGVAITVLATNIKHLYLQMLNINFYVYNKLLVVSMPVP